MALSLTKDSIDLGIVVKDPERSLAFYRDTLGLSYLEEVKLPGWGLMHRLQCGTSHVKLVVLDHEAPAPPPGGIPGGTGYRYCTISVSNLEEVLESCSAAGYRIAVAQNELRPGVEIAMVEDPDGNWVEFVRR